MAFHREEAIAQGDNAAQADVLWCCKAHLLLRALITTEQHRKQPITMLHYSISHWLISAPHQWEFEVLHELPDLFCFRKMVRHYQCSEVYESQTTLHTLLLSSHWFYSVMAGHEIEWEC